VLLGWKSLSFNLHFLPYTHATCPSHSSLKILSGRERSGAAGPTDPADKVAGL